jgi:hypothetical protein
VAPAAERPPRAAGGLRRSAVVAPMAVTRPSQQCRAFDGRGTSGTELRPSTTSSPSRASQTSMHAHPGVPSRSRSPPPSPPPSPPRPAAAAAPGAHAAPARRGPARGDDHGRGRGTAANARSAGRRGRPHIVRSPHRRRGKRKAQGPGAVGVTAKIARGPHRV